jgi:hypothetical protein
MCICICKGSDIAYIVQLTRALFCGGFKNSHRTILLLLTASYKTMTAS